MGTEERYDDHVNKDGKAPPDERAKPESTEQDSQDKTKALWDSAMERAQRQAGSSGREMGRRWIGAIVLGLLTGGAKKLGEYLIDEALRH